MVTNIPDLQQHSHTHTHSINDSDIPPCPKINGAKNLGLPILSTPHLSQVRKINKARVEESGCIGGESDPDYVAQPDHHSSDRGTFIPCKNMPCNRTGNSPSSKNSGQYAHLGQQEKTVGQLHNPKDENVVLRRGFVPRTAPEKMAQRRSSMTQLQQWVNHRRGMVSQEHINR